MQQNGFPLSDFRFDGGDPEAGSAHLRIGGLSVSSVYAPALRGKTIARPMLGFAFYLSGSGRIAVEHRRVEWTAGRSILSVSCDMPMDVAVTRNAVIILRPRGEDIAAAMACVTAARGRPADAAELVARLQVRGPFLDTGSAWSRDYSAAVLQLVSLIDSCHCDEELLQRIGVEEVFNRLLAELVLDQQGLNDPTEGRMSVPRSQRAVDLVCDAIANDIGRPLTIPEMERLTGVTGRTLNYAFQERFGCSPQEWQRNFLLDHARRLLSDGERARSVKEVAYELGFSSPASFSNFYRRRFGELPSSTLFDRPGRR